MNLLSLILIIPLSSALISTLCKSSLSVQKLITLTGITGSTAVSVYLLINNGDDGIVTLNTGSWESRIGIVLVSDIFSSLMLTVTGFTALCVLIYSMKEIETRIQSRFFYPLFNLLILGVNGSFITGDIFNLYVWFEVMLLSSFVLLTIGRKADQLEGAVKYVVINLFSSFLFLIGVGLLYAKVGSLNLADIALKITEDNSGHLLNTTGVIFLVSFGFKAALFPFFFWLPASYHTPPTSISALFAGLLTKVGVYALVRVFSLLFLNNSSHFVNVFAVLGILTMVIGVLCAASQFEIRKILSVHIVSQIGYMILGLAIYTPLAVAGAIFYIIHNILVKTNLFLICGIVEKIKGTADLAKIGGLYRAHPFLSFMFSLAAFSLAGLPPLSGFWAKLSIMKAAAESEHYVYLGTGLAVSVITLYSMTKIWTEAFWKDQPEGVIVTEHHTTSKVMVFPVIIMTVAALFVGIFGNYVFQICIDAANQLLNPQLYIEAVRGGNL